MMTHTLWLARHANREDFVDPDWAKTAERPHDPGLSDDGIAQARKLARRLAEASITHVYASPFLRTVHTAHVAARALDRPLVLEPGLAEWMNPSWFDAPPDLLAPEVLSARFPAVRPATSPCARPTFPESKAEAFARAGAAARCLAERHAEGDAVLLVGHGASVYGALRGLVNDAADTGCPLASVTKLVRKQDEWHIALRNDTSHLDQFAAADRFH